MNQQAYLLFPITTPTLSPGFMPMFKRPRASALICLSNSWKSHARCFWPPQFLLGGPPWALGASFGQIKAGRLPCFGKISCEKYSGSVEIAKGGCKGPSTDDSVNDRLDGRTRPEICQRAVFLKIRDMMHSQVARANADQFLLNGSLALQAILSGGRRGWGSRNYPHRVSHLYSKLTDAKSCRTLSIIKCGIHK